MSGLNVTVEALKNIVTDKPAPLTVPLVYPGTPYVPVAIIPYPVPVGGDKKSEKADDEKTLQKKPSTKSFV